MTDEEELERRATVLVVDDEPANVAFLERLLDRAGHRVESTTDAREAEELFTACEPDLVLLDLRMPHVSGFAILESVRERVPAEEHLPVLVLTADVTTEIRHRALAMGATDFLNKPLDAIEVQLRVANLLHARRLHLTVQGQRRRLEERVRERTQELRQAVLWLQDSERELRTAHEETIQRLATAAEFRDEDTARHVHRMSQYAGVLAGRAGMATEPREALRLASTLHDVGKIGVSDTILLKPGPLTEEEFERVKEHATFGYDILKGSSAELLELAARVAWTHHERWDGTGYPRGIAGEEIPLEGRIAGIADVFDALTSDRVYRPAFEVDRAVAMMRENRGSHFDPELLDLFLDDLDEVLEIRRVLADPVPAPGVDDTDH